MKNKDKYDLRKIHYRAFERYIMEKVNETKYSSGYSRKVIGHTIFIDYDDGKEVKKVAEIETDILSPEKVFLNWLEEDADE